MYRPLPDGITIKESAIEGLGLFTEMDIELGTILGVAHIANVNFPHGYIRTGLGAFYNHSDDPNCKSTDGYWQHMKAKYLVAIKSIKAGEELTAKYTLYEFEEE